MAHYLVGYKKSAKSIVPAGTKSAGIFGLFKVALLFAPFVLLHGCSAGRYPGCMVIFVGFSVPMLLPFFLVPLAAPFAISLPFYYPTEAHPQSCATWGLTISCLSLLGLAWTGGALISPADPFGSDTGAALLWGFWALLACDQGMIGG